MATFKRLMGKFFSSKLAQKPSVKNRVKLQVEALEDRCVPASLVVWNSSDLLNEPGTLRAAVNQANQDGYQGISDSISFQTGTSATHILLQQGHLELTVGAKVSIWGTGSFGAKMVLNGDGGNIFQVDRGAWLDLHELTLAGGDANAYTGPNGGAIKNDGVLTLSLCSFVNNTATGLGGAIYNTGAVSVRYASTFTGNSAQAGGAVYNDGGTASLYGVFTNNSASGAGGAIGNVGVMTVAASTLSGNTSQHDNGGAISNAGVMTVTDSTVSGNTALEGGGIDNSSGATMTMSNDTLAHNTASGDYGGAILNHGPLTVSATTISGNSASVAGGGISNETTLTLQDTIVAANTVASFGPDPDIYGGTVAAASSYNLIGNASVGGLSGISDGVNHNQVGNHGSPINPLLAPLGTYSGSNQTMPLVSGSPALAAGGSITTVSAPDVTAQTSVIGVANAAFFSSGQSIQIDSEPMLVTYVNVANNTLTVDRASGPIVFATSHSAGAGVYFSVDQRRGAVPRPPSIGAAQPVAGEAVSLTVSRPVNVTAGIPFNVTITAKDSFGQTVLGDNDPVSLATTDGQFVFLQSGPVTLVQGQAIVSVVLDKEDDTRFTASAGSLTAASDVFGVNPGAFTNVDVTVPSSVTAGVAFQTTITAKDSFGNPTYPPIGQVVVKNGSQVLVTAQWSAGTTTNVFPTLSTPGTNVTLTATVDGVTGTSQGITVLAGKATRIVVSAQSVITAGVPFTVTCTAADATGATDPTNFETFTLATSGVYSESLGSFTFNKGEQTISLTLTRATAPGDLITLKATGSTISGSTYGTMTVKPGPLDTFVFTASATVYQGVPFSVTLTAQDAYQNTIYGYKTDPTLSTAAEALAPLIAWSDGVGTATGLWLENLGAVAINATVAGANKGSCSVDVVSAISSLSANVGYAAGYSAQYQQTGSEVDIFGQGFQPGCTVIFGPTGGTNLVNLGLLATTAGVGAQPFFNDGTTLKVNVPAYALTGGITILQADSVHYTQSQLAQPFTVNDYRNTFGFSFTNFVYNVDLGMVTREFGDLQTFLDPFTTAAVFGAAVATVNGNGACFGMSLTSLLMSEFNPGSINGTNGLPNGAAATVFNLNRNDALTGQIQQNHLAQFSGEIIDEYLQWQGSSHSASGIQAQIGGMLANGNHPIIGLQAGASHSVVAYGIDNGPLGNGDYYIDVYDNNNPFNSDTSEVTSITDHVTQAQQGRIYINPASGWSFTMAGGTPHNGGWDTMEVYDPTVLFTNSPPSLPNPANLALGFFFGSSGSAASAATGPAQPLLGLPASPFSSAAAFFTNPGDEHTPFTQAVRQDQPQEGALRPTAGHAPVNRLTAVDALFAAMGSEAHDRWAGQDEALSANEFTDALVATDELGSRFAKWSKQ